MNGSVVRLGLALSCASVLASAQNVLRVATPSGETSVRCEVLRHRLLDDDGKEHAEMCAFAYLGDDPERPVTFLWNGGPGFPALLLHLGFGGPEISDLAEGNGRRANPYPLVDCTDLVYVDPVGTGFSKPIAPATDDAFRGVFEDASAAAQFVAAVVAERGWHDRPIYLCGESYAGLRVGAMLAPLSERGVVPAGLIMISALFDTGTLSTKPGSRADAMRALDFVPTLAAIAAHDGTVTTEEGVRAHVEQAVRFAQGPLRVAVESDQDLEDLDDTDLAARFEELTPIPSRRRLRGRDAYDCRERFRGGRFAGMKNGVRGRELRHVLQTRFAVDDVADYKMTARGLGFGYIWRGRDAKPYLTCDIRASKMIAAACRERRKPRMFVAGGWFDCVVPFGAARRLHADGAFGDCDVVLRDYAAGHMIYVDDTAHRAFVRDLRGWFAAGSR